MESWNTLMTMVELVVNARVNIYHLSMINSGLAALADQGEIDLRFRGPRGAEEDELIADPLAVCLFIAGGQGSRPRLAAIDLHDQSDVFAEGLLERCDLYLKRSFHEPDLWSLVPGLAAKVQPFGLNFACRTGSSTTRLLRAIGLGVLSGGHPGLRKLRHFFALPDLKDYEQAPETPVKPSIVFQTRVWEADEASPGEADELNSGRVAVIRALRSEFGGRFLGGLMPTPLAFAKYPGEVSPFSARRREYISFSKKSIIGVYTRGLFGSTAFKLPEYLAASQCVVAEEPRNGLPAALVPGQHYMPFRTPGDCVEACRRLLADPAMAASMRQANHEYYLKEVEPSARVRTIVGRSLGCPPITGPLPRGPARENQRL